MIILLTGCINPKGMAFTSLSDQEERKAQYINAIQYYLSNTSIKIVFSENSGTDISYLFKDAIESGRIEFLSFSGNQDKIRGKGYGECEIIEYTLDNSKLIHSSKDQRIAKITGRLIIRNIKGILRWHKFFFPKKTVICSINSDLSFPDSRFIVAPVSFYKVLLHSKELINDSNGYYFEHALCDTLKKEKKYSYYPFLFMPRIKGISGSTGEIYNGERGDIIYKYRYFKYMLSLYRKFKKRYRR
jgi:hypothetical protein